MAVRLAAIALIVVVVAAELMLTQRPEAARVRTGSYAELARAEAREGGPYVQTPDPCDAFETIPGQGDQPVRLPCERSDEPSETPEERNWVEIREGGAYACTVSLPPCWDPAHDPLRGDLHR